jgi:hypothetical protein
VVKKPVTFALVLTALVASCTGGLPPKPAPSHTQAQSVTRIRTATDLADAVRRLTGQLKDCGVPFGPAGGTGDLQCTFRGALVRFLSYDSTGVTPTNAAGLHNRTVVFGPTWMVIAETLAQGRAVRRIVGGRLVLTSVLTSEPTIRLLPATPDGGTVRFSLGVRNPMDRPATIVCSTRGLSADDKILFREAGREADDLRRSFAAHERSSLTAEVPFHLPAMVTKIVAWCLARPASQPR